MSPRIGLDLQIDLQIDLRSARNLQQKSSQYICKIKRSPGNETRFIQ